MGGFTFPPLDNQVPAFQDTGQGASGRIASWWAFVADPNPLPGPEQTNIWRQDDNMGLGVRVPLGQGGCGSWSPILDGSGNGATSGGSWPIYVNQ